MLEQEKLEFAHEVLTDEQLDAVAGGDDGMGNIPICPPWFPGLPGHPHGPVVGTRS
jgi:hypothetical protein